MSGKVLLAAPRGYCAGVERAVEAVELALEGHGRPVYVRKQIVHNLHVVRDLEAKGAIFVDDVEEVPAGAVAVLSAHGSPPRVFEEAAARGLDLIDATCPLVTKVHVEARRFAADGRTIVLIGHAGHEEVEGTSGQAAERTVLVQDLEDARTVTLPEGPMAYLTQTTLSVDETSQIVDVLRTRYPHLEAPPREDICYATQNRQDAVKAMAPQADVVLVIGSRNSSNSNRLAEVAADLGTPGSPRGRRERGRPRLARGRRGRGGDERRERARAPRGADARVPRGARVRRGRAGGGRPGGRAVQPAEGRASDPDHAQLTGRPLSSRR